MSTKADKKEELEELPYHIQTGEKKNYDAKLVDQVEPVEGEIVGFQTQNEANTAATRVAEEERTAERWKEEREAAEERRETLDAAAAKDAEIDADAEKKADAAQKKTDAAKADARKSA